MAISLTPEHTRTFRELRTWALREAGVQDHFAFLALGANYATFWEGMNRQEFDRGYTEGDYQRAETPRLEEMRLLTETEYRRWQDTFRFFHEKK